MSNAERPTPRRRPYAWPVLCLSVAVLLAADSPPKAEKPKVEGPDPAAYAPLGRIVVLHSGRRKPLDTVARQEVKIITGRQEFEPTGPDGEPLGKWQPMPAFWSWASAPDVWDDRHFLLVEYLPLKEHLLAGRVQAALRTIAENPKADASLKALLEPMLKADRLTADDLLKVARHTSLSDEDQNIVEAWAHRLSADGKLLSPREVQDAQVKVDGRELTFAEWFAEAARASQAGGMGMGATPKLSPMDDNLLELSKRLARYRVIAGEPTRMILPAIDHAVPRPSTDAYIKFLADTLKKYDDIQAKPENQSLDFPKVDRLRRDKQSNEIFVATTGGRELMLDEFLDVLADDRIGLNEIERDAVATLVRYYVELAADDRVVPGKDSQADEMLKAWIREDSDWAPLSPVLKAPADQLVAAGYPSKELEAVRAADPAAREAEANDPGKLDVAKAEAVASSLRALADSVSSYPSVAAIGREVHYNAFAPFYRAPSFFGIATLLIGACLTFRPKAGTGLARLQKGLYLAGMASFLGAIALEIYGFYLRVAISGWAPVTNIYETVIWVALVAAVIGLALELIYGKGYAAAAAAGVATLCTIVAANATSVLNPNIESLQPVLRSNYWLTIHVITIVSSYAAFALGMGLGLIGLWYYLTATYRRDVGYRELIRPLFAGLPISLVGLGMAYPQAIGVSLAEATATSMFYLGWLVAVPGIVLVVMALSSCAGELISRMTYREQDWIEASAVEHSKAEAVSSASPAREMAMAGGGSGGGTATLEAPPTDSFRARFGAGRVELTPRERSMQATAANLKPLASYLYRAVQVGVLLVAAGTILGGVWADYSWGRFWGWDPKEVSALITLLAYLVPLHGRFAGWIKTFGLVCASVFCFNFVLIAWYGVNFLLGVGLHSYGFAEGGNQGVVLLTALLLNAIVAGTIWRRSLAQKVTTAPLPA